MSLLTFTPLSIVRLPHPLRSSAGDFLHSSPFPGLLPPEPSPILRFQLLYRAPNVPRRISFAVSGCLPVSASSHLTQDAVATAAVLVGAYGLVFTFDSLTGRNLIQQGLSRKLVHILSGLIFMASWPIFSTSTSARYFASLVPMVNCLRLLVHGFSLVNDDGLIKSVTRHGNPEELLRGPLYYVIVLILCALVFWRESPVGVISLSMMCGGDGVADIMGRKFGSVKIPYNPGKSWAGSISMFVFGFLVSVGMLYYFSALGYIQLDWSSTIQRVALVAMVATVVESLPISEAVDDNLSVPLATMIAAYLSFNL
ncbi:probable phytol kinase 1, chloroplastic isoform X1 [Humulus lupulus]|uniref:probable phytol kinase 1, chloroplastic isoform X1 n=1 Tax=Humulus lupulus TaxID=3486 RepID=UPI002B408AA5|nr:probable phytol kinase 1, chloroplastic isoform X1 [Humulus lupulus]